MRDHGGNIDRAREIHGGTDWIDLSTGINPVPYPVPELPASAWAALPTRAAMADLLASASTAYGTKAPMLALAGAQSAIQLLPRLRAAGLARVLVPTYNEHAVALRAAGWQVEEKAGLGELAGADLAVVVNPNNPDGRVHSPAALMDIARQVGMLVVDESFIDPRPELSLAPHVQDGRVIVLRSFGKFFGLAGVRLGFAIGGAEIIGAMAEMAGPWPVCGPAIAIGTRALADRSWMQATIGRLKEDIARLDRLAHGAGWRLVGGTELFRLYDTPDAGEAQAHLARHRIWSRIFPYSRSWLRLGLPASLGEWGRLRAALDMGPRI